MEALFDIWARLRRCALPILYGENTWGFSIAQYCGDLGADRYPPQFAPQLEDCLPGPASGGDRMNMPSSYLSFDW